MRASLGHATWAMIVLGLVVASIGGPLGSSPPAHPTHAALSPVATGVPSAAPSPVANFTNSINRLVDLVAAAGGGILALVWARVAFSWFSNDITKKVQAKDRARDALVGTLVFTAAITGLVWGLAQWVLTGA